MSRGRAPISFTKKVKEHGGSVWVENLFTLFGKSKGSGIGRRLTLEETIDLVNASVISKAEHNVVPDGDFS